MCTFTVKVFCLYTYWGNYITYKILQRICASVGVIVLFKMIFVGE